MEANLQEIFPRYAYSGVSLRRILWHLFTRHGKIVNTIITIKLMVGVIFLVLRYRFNESTSKELQLLVYGIIWLIVLSVSTICCYIYIKLICNFKLTLLFEQCQRSGTIFVLQLMVAMLCLGLLSTYTLFQLVQRVDARLKNMEFSSLWKAFFYITAFVRILQRLLATLFICLALPVTKKWVEGLKTDTKRLLLELLPWKIFLFLHRNILLTTFFGKPLYYFDVYEDSVYVVSIVFRSFSMLWLVFMVLYVGYDFAIPWKYDTQAEGARELAGTTAMILAYPPKSKLVTGLSAGYYVFRYKGFPSKGEAERERRAQMRNNAVKHERYRILFSELE